MARKKTKWDGEKMRELVEQVGMKALRVQGEVILTHSIPEAPILTGTLRRSGTVTTGALPSDPGSIYQAARPIEEGGQALSHEKAFPDSIGSQKAVFISFNTPYALRQHEELGFNHPKGGKALYLQDPFNRNKDKAIEYVKLKVKKALRQAQ